MRDAMSRNDNHGKGRKNHRNNTSTQQFPIAGSSGSGNLSPIQGGGSNRNFPSGSTGNNPQNFRTFTRNQIKQFCNYDPCKDFNRCLNQSINAVPSRWTRAQTEDIEITMGNSAPIIRGDIPRTSEDLWIWDMWPLMEKDGSIAVLPGGWRVLFALSAPRSVLPDRRHDVARIAYFYSRDGSNWIQGGLVFEEGTAFGSRQWAGSAMIDNGRIYYFYTASGRRGESTITYEQRIALSSSGFVSDLDGVRLVNFAPHEIILEPDGVLYQTLAQSQVGDAPIIYAFRDPWFFKDPATGCEYLLFEGNIAGTYLDVNCGPDVPAESRFYTGNIGIALLRNESFSSWQLLPALLEAGCTNQQTERPHIVVSNGLYYLFTDSHRFTFAPGTNAGPDGLYGFYAGSLRGNYVPLNNGGLVVANPIEEPNQAYSWLVLPDFSVLSFVDTYDLQGITTAELATLPESFQVEHFGGSLAPTLQLRVSGNMTQIVWEYGFGLVMVSETESPKCGRNGSEDMDDGNNHDHHCGCSNKRNRHEDDCDDDDDHHDDDCGCSHNHHHRDDDEDDHDHDDDCGCSHNHHHRDRNDNGNGGSNKRRHRDNNGNHDGDCGCSHKHKHNHKNDDCIVFPTPDPNRFLPNTNCQCR